MSTLDNRDLKFTLLGDRWRQFLGVVRPHKVFQKSHEKYPQASLSTVLTIPSDHGVTIDV